MGYFYTIFARKSNEELDIGLLAALFNDLSIYMQYYQWKSKDFVFLSSLSRAEICGPRTLHTLHVHMYLVVIKWIYEYLLKYLRVCTSKIRGWGLAIAFAAIWQN